LNRLDEVLASMEQLTNINKLIALLLEIQEKQVKEETEYILRKKELEDNIFKTLEAPDKPKKPEKKQQ
jgi:hypothetical protein